MVLDSYFNLTNKFNLSDRLWYDLIQFFDHLIVDYFLGHRVHNSDKNLKTQWGFENPNPPSGYAIDETTNRNDFFSRHRVDYCVTDHADDSAAAVNEGMESHDRIFS